jgi:hypothetical protein
MIPKVLCKISRTVVSLTVIDLPDLLILVRAPSLRSQVMKSRMFSGTPYCLKYSKHLALIGLRSSMALCFLAGVIFLSDGYVSTGISFAF